MIIEKYKNFTVMQEAPTGDFYEPFKHASGILYLSDDNGVEWYDFATNIAPISYVGMYFVVVSSTNQALSITQDASSLFPSNCSVFVIDNNPFEGTEIQDWEYIDTDFVCTHRMQSQLVQHAVENQLIWVSAQLAAYASTPAAADYLNELIDYRSELVSINPNNTLVDDLPAVPKFFIK